MPSYAPTCEAVRVLADDDGGLLIVEPGDPYAWHPFASALDRRGWETTPNVSRLARRLALPRGWMYGALLGLGLGVAPHVRARRRRSCSFRSRSRAPPPSGSSSDPARDSSRLLPSPRESATARGARHHRGVRRRVWRRGRQRGRAGPATRAERAKRAGCTAGTR